MAMCVCVCVLPADFVKNRKKNMTEFNLSICFNSGIYLLFDNLYSIVCTESCSHKTKFNVFVKS